MPQKLMIAFNNHHPSLLLKLKNMPQSPELELKPVVTSKIFYMIPDLGL